jgi:hypothetical protein
MCWDDLLGRTSLMLNVSVEQKHDMLGEIFFLISEQEQSLREALRAQDQFEYTERAERINALLDAIVSE